MKQSAQVRCLLNLLKALLSNMDEEARGMRRWYCIVAEGGTRRDLRTLHFVLRSTVADTAQALEATTFWSTAQLAGVGAAL